MGKAVETNPDTCHVFLDTNIYLHAKHISEIDWCALTETSQVMLVVPHVVIAELDKHKDSHHRAVIQKRAGKALRYIEQVLLDGGVVAEGVDLCDYVLKADFDYKRHNLNPDICDDQLLASCMAYREDAPNMKVTLFTHDIGPRLKARPLKIDAQSLPDDYKLPPEKDPVEKENERLRAELVKLENRLPKLRLAFEDSRDFTEVEIIKPRELDEDKLSEYMEKVRADYPLKDVPNRENKTLSEMAALQLNCLESPEDFNERLEVFYAEMSKFLRSVWDYENLYRPNSFDLIFCVVNNGSGPAEDIDIKLHFPDGFRLYGPDDNTPPEATPPTPPKPKTLGDIVGGKMCVSVPSLSAMGSSIAGINANVGCISVTKTNSYDVDLHIKKLKHNCQEQLEPLTIWFDDYDIAESFTIEYTMHVGNYPEPFLGELHVKVSKKE